MNDTDMINFFEKIPKKKTDIVFFDIDDTLLRPYAIEPTPVQPVLNFYKYLTSHGYNVAIITARADYEENLKYTLNDLKNIGIENDYKYLILRPQYIEDIKEFKKMARKGILDKGYTPLMSIGDMYWDVGEYGGIGIIVLPDN
jgi:predicted secreted acid phosphatase